jgi:hypothetical protein
MFRLCASIAFISSLLLLGSVVNAQPPGAEAQPEAPEIPKTEQLLEEINAISSEYRALEQKNQKVEGEDKTVIALQMRDQVLEFIRKVDKLVAEVVRQREQGVKHPAGIKRTRALLLEMDRSIPEFIDALEAAAGEQRTALADASEEAREDFEIRLRGVEDVLDEVYPFFFEHLGHRESLGLDAGNGRKQLEKRLSERAEEVLGSLPRDHPKVLEDPKPVVNVHKLSEYATQFIVRPWLNRADYWAVYWELMREAKIRLDREQLPLGIPRHDVLIHGDPPA